MDRLTSLTVFVRVVDNGGFSAAGRRLNMSTTMVSNHVQALEDRLGARLLNRTTRKVSLTEIGRQYYERCVQILADIEEADSMAGMLQSTPRGVLRIHTNTAVVRFMAPVVGEYMQQNPQVSVDYTAGERAVDILEEGYDLAIRTTPPPDSSLIVRRLTPWRHILCCSPEYMQSHGMPEQPDDLAQHNCMRYVFYPFGDEWAFTDSAGRRVTARVGGNVMTNSGEVLRRLALQGRGIFLAPSFLVAEDIEAGRLVRIMTGYKGVELSISAIYPHRHHLSAKVRGFIDLLALRMAAHRKMLNPGEDAEAEASAGSLVAGEDGGEVDAENV